MDLIIPEGINQGDNPRVPKAPRRGPEVDPRRVIKDIFHDTCDHVHSNVISQN